MKARLLATIACLGVGTLAMAVPDDGARSNRVTNLTPDFTHFQIILDRMPFGRPPPAPTPAAQPEEAKQALAEQALAKQIRLCAVTRTQQGVAAGLIDSSANPAKNYYLYVGDEKDGVTLIAANLEEESAEIEKNGVRLTFTLTGVKSATPPAGPALASRLPEARPATALPVPHAATVTITPATDVPRPGRIQRPSQVGAPPIPAVIPAGKMAEMKKTHAEIAKLKETGGDVTSYMTRLRERKAQENAAKAAAEQAAREKLQELTRKVTEQELAKQEREINLQLIEQGARPISNIELTPEEEKALIEKGVLQ
jgi:hypothetical protein